MHVEEKGARTECPAMTDSLARLADKHEITEVIHRLARGLDRCDEDLLRESFHPGATDDHGAFVGTAEGYIAWVLPMLATFERTQHFVTNILVEVEGERAFTESHFQAWRRVVEDGAAVDQITAGRYLDRFEKREGSWAIVHRRAIRDWTHRRLCDRPESTHSRRDGADPSYIDRDEFLG